MRNRVLRLGAAAALAATGYLHADLYLHGYRVIRTVGPAFLLLASGSFAVAVLLCVGRPLVLRLAAVALAVGALGGFAASRTVGVFGFVERGLQPAPQAVLSLLAETAVLALLGAEWLTARPGAARSGTGTDGSMEVNRGGGQGAAG